MKTLNKVLIVIATTFILLSSAELSTAQTGRGVKRDKEACEEMALQPETNPRASASAVSMSEAIAYKTAMVDARAELAAQIAAQIAGFIRRRVEQHQLTAGAGTSVAINREGVRGSVTGNENSPRTISALIEADSAATIQCVAQILVNTRPVCKNTYDRDDGSVQVYVCVEMGLPAQRRAYGKLKEQGVLNADLDNDGNNDIDFSEKEFLLELAKAREEYNAKKTKNEN